MQDYIDYKIKDTSLINSGQDNTIRVYTHKQKWKIIEDLEEQQDYKNIPLTDETKENFKKFYIDEFCKVIHYKMTDEVIISDLEIKEDSVHVNNPNYDWVQFKCIMQEDKNVDIENLNLNGKKLPIDQFKRQEEYYGIQKVLNSKIWGNLDFKPFFENKDYTDKYFELLDFYDELFNINIKDDGLNRELNEHNVTNNIRFLIRILYKYKLEILKKNYNISEATIMDLFRFSEQSIDIFSNITFDEDFYYNNGPLHVQNNGTTPDITDDTLTPWKFKEQYNDNNDIEQQEADNMQSNPDITQDKKLVCFSNYDINRLFGDVKQLEQIMEI